MHPPKPIEQFWDDLPTQAQRDQLKTTATEFEGSHNINYFSKKFSNDCSGFVASIYYLGGIDIYQNATANRLTGNGVSLIYQYVEKHGTLFNDPNLLKSGDLVFFSNTYDKNNDQKVNDPLTHVGIVTRIDGDGSVVFTHHINGKVERGVFDLNHKSTHTLNGRIVNSYLRRHYRQDKKTTPYLAGSLVQTFGSIVKDFDVLPLNQTRSQS